MLKKLNWLAPALSIALFTGVGSAIVGTTTAQPSVAQAKQAKQSIWKTFSPAGSGFSILMPGAPQVTRDSLALKTGGSVDVVMYLVDRGSAGKYAVMHLDVPFSDTQKNSSQLLDRFLESMLNRMGGELVSQQALALNGYPGREVTLREDNALGTVRGFLVQNRFYLIMAETSQPKATAKSISGFLKSFKLVNN